MPADDNPILGAHKHCSRHRSEILASEKCGCFYCLLIFGSDEIESWCDEVDDIGQTALCPRCQIDSVIGSSSGYPITESFLEEMKKHWFSISN